MFCPKCGSIIIPKKKEGKTIVICSCGYEEKDAKHDKVAHKNTQSHKEVEVVSKDYSTDALTKEECPKCGHDEAYYFLKQTRSADESPTKFLRCAKCKHTWRDYS